MPVTYPVPVPKDSPFPLGNIPFGIFSPRGSSAANGAGGALTGGALSQQSRLRAGTAIGEFVLDLDVLARHGLFVELGCSDSADNFFARPTLNAFAACPATQRRGIRDRIMEELGDEDSVIFKNQQVNTEAFVPLAKAEMHMPMAITDYSDCFGSLIHAENGLAPNNLPFPPAWFQFPLSYNGRTGGLALSGLDLVRPAGIYPDATTKEIAYRPTKQLDFEMGLGMFVAEPIASAELVPATKAADHVFGFVLHNDWSARDVQMYEMVPLGVFNSKSFRTTISPWVITPEALQGCKSRPPPSNATEINPMLVCDEKNHGLWDIQLTAQVFRQELPPVEITNVNHRDDYWTPYQMLAYHSLAGCGVNTGDLLSTGTISSPRRKTSDDDKREPRRGTYGCLTESHCLKEVLPLVGGKPLQYIEDGDELLIEGWFKTVDGSRAGFGPMSTRVLPPVKSQ